MLSKKIRGQFPGQTKEKKEEGLKWGEWVGVSIGFPFGGLEEPNIYHDSGVFYKEVGRMWMDVCVEIKMIYKTNIILPL